MNARKRPRNHFVSGSALVLALIAGLLLVSCGSGARRASEFKADVAFEWYRLAYRLTRSEGLSAPVASRIYGYLGVTLYESVAPGMPENRSLAGLVNGELVIPQPRAGETYYWPAVANSALATVMPAFYRRENSYLAIAALNDAQSDAARTAVSATVLRQSEAYGRDVGLAVLRWALSDGYESLQGCQYKPPSGLAAWIPTPPGYAEPMEPCWGRLRPFAIRGVSQYRPGPPTAYSEAPGSKFLAESLEVYLAVQNVSAAEREIAQHWSDDPLRTGTPPGHSLALLTQLLAEREKRLDFAAEAYARTGMAVADAFISCWDTKYFYNLVRPVTVIQARFDPDWIPPLNTPPFPEYTSGHSVQTAAAAVVMSSMLGDGPFVDRVHEGAGRQPRSFQSFGAMADEAAISRLYGGIHFRPAIEVGIKQGTRIGEAVMALELAK